MILKPTHEAMERRIKKLEARISEFEKRDIQYGMMEERLAGIQRIAHIGYWDRDLVRDRLFWSEGIYRIYGLDPEKTEPSFDRIGERIHPEDKALVDGSFEDAKFRAKPYIIEYRIILPSGEVRHVRSLSKIETDKKGRTIRIQGTTQDITHQKRAEEALRESEERYRTLFDASPNTILIMQNEKYILCNPTAARVFGLSGPEEVEDLSVFELIAPDSIQIVKDRMKNIVSGKTNPPVEIEIIRKDGKHAFIESMSVPIRLHGQPATFIIGRDITERKQVIEDLMTERDRAQMYLDIAGVFFVALDRQGKVTLINKKGMEISGYTEEEVIGKSWFDHFIIPGDRETVKAVFYRLMKGDVEPAEYHENPIVTKEGKTKVLAWHNALLRDEKGEITGTLSSGEDITGRKLAEEEKERLEIQLRHALKMEAIGTLAGGIAHDFNNILGIIIGNTDLAMMDIPGENPVYHNLEEIHKACLRARDLVKQILAFSRQSKQEMKPLKMTPIVKESLKFLRSSIPTTIEIRQDFKNKNDTIMADVTQINQVLLNLCTNAAHSMRETNGVLEVRLEDERLTKKKITQYDELIPDEYVKLTVRDTGHGIDQEIMSRIFDPYFTTKEVGNGTGMGLAVVHGIVKNHKGAILVSSKPRKGTTFTVLFPAVKENAVIEQAIAATLPKGNERILLVDDEKAITDALQSTLERLGYGVISKNSGVEALEEFEKNPESFDLIITDMTMPKMTGLVLAKNVLNIRPDIPIILCTGYSDLINGAKAKEMGIRMFMMKPLIISNMAAGIREILEENGSETAV